MQFVNFPLLISSYGDGGSQLCYNEVLDITDVEPSGGFNEPVTPAEAKNFCKIDDIPEDDDLIEMLITACREECEAITNTGFVRRDVIVTLNNGNGGSYLPLGPVGDISAITDIDGNDLSDSLQTTGTTWKRLIAPCYSPVVITYEAGYETLPKVLKRALLECIFYRYDERKQREGSQPAIYLETLKPYIRVW